MFQKGDYVYWSMKIKGSLVERAGVVESVIPAFTSPKEYIPKDMFFTGKFYKRNTASFVVGIPGMKRLYWPLLESLQPLQKDQWHILYDQQIFKALSVPADTNRDDRTKIRATCQLVCDAFKERMYENDSFIVVPAWGRRFWFKVADGVEYVCKVDDFRPIKGV